MSEKSAIPRENFVIGEGGYTNWLLLRFCATPRTFEIVPAPLPTAALIALGFVILAMGFAMAWFLRDKTSSAMFSFIAAFSVVTAGGTALAIASTHRSRQKAGCAFRFNRETGEVFLPDRNEAFSADSQFSFVLIESPFYSPTGSGGDSVAELQLLVEKDGQAERVVIAKADSVFTLKPLVDELHRHLAFPIREVRHHGMFKTTVVEKAYESGWK